MIALLGLAAQLTIVAHGANAVTACEPLEISVAVGAPGTGVPRVSVPPLSPFEVLRSSVVPRIWREPSIPGVQFAEFKYVLATDAVGTFVIPPFEARIGSTTVRSEPIRVEVRLPHAAPAPVVVARARVDTSLEVNLRALSTPETVYVGQQANYEVAVFLSETVRERLKRNPTFFPPEIQSMLAYDIPAQNPNRRRGGGGSRCFDAMAYQRAIFPLLPGRFVIPPAQLVYALPVTQSFFSREETHELQTDSAVVIAIEPPQLGRPAGYQGAVGDLHVQARLDTSRGRVGEPVVLTVRVAGTGNVKLFPRPDVQLPWAAVVRGDERVSVDTTVQRVRGSKEFDWVLTPKIAGEFDVPPLSYAYFNPNNRRYEVAATNSVHMRVGVGAMAAGDTARSDQVLAIRPRYRGPLGLSLEHRPLFWVLLAIAPVPALGFRRRKRDRTSAALATSTSDDLAALARDPRLGGTGAATASVVRRAYTRSLAVRLGLSAESFTRAGAVARTLRRAGVSTEVAQQAEALMRELDAAAYAREGALPPDAAARAASVYAAADREALPAAEARRRLVTMLSVVLVLGAASAALATTDTRVEFEHAVAAYGTQDYAGARNGFAAVAEIEPRAADAWANAGTAAWMLGDTATAVTGWQRALRLEPLAADVRERVQLAHSLPLSGAGVVPPLPADAVFALALGCWLVCWGMIAWRAHASRRRWTRLPVLCGIAAAMLLVAGHQYDAALVGRQRGVIRVSSLLSVDPTMSSERRTTAIVGEVVRVRESQGAWARVVLDDGRAGWVAQSALILLDPSLVAR